jgi:membrane protease YdiL (CAAX protease family)
MNSSLLKPVALYSADHAKGWIPWGALAPFLCLVLVVAPSLGAEYLLEYLGLLDAKGDAVGFNGLVALLLFPFSMMALAVVVWVLLVERRSLATAGLVGRWGAAKFVLGHAIGLITICAVVGAIWLAGGLEAGEPWKAAQSPDALMRIGILLVCFAVQSSAEEFVFRGWLLSAIARKFNVALAVVLSSMVFSLLHYGPGQPWLVTLGTFLFGLFACAWALKAGSIWGVMGWHAGWNWLLATGFELPVTGLDADVPALLVHLTAIGPRELTGGAQGPEGSLFCLLFFAGAIGWLMWRSRGHPDASSATA